MAYEYPLVWEITAGCGCGYAPTLPPTKCVPNSTDPNGMRVELYVRVNSCIDVGSLVAVIDDCVSRRHFSTGSSYETELQTETELCFNIGATTMRQST